MTSTVIRVKRRIDDQPYDKFVLNCKRIKLDDGTNQIETKYEPEKENTQTVLKFATTVNDDEDINTHLTKLNKSVAEELVQKVRKPTDILSKLREQLKSDKKNHRYKIVKCFRSTNNDGESSDKTIKDVTFVDVIKENVADQEKESIKTASTSNESDAISKFVYDLYLVASGVEPTEFNIDNYISIQPFDDLVYQTNDETFDSDIDSEDSNDEAHWRNEYPDTDENISIGEEDMRRAVEDLHFGSGKN